MRSQMKSQRTPNSAPWLQLKFTYCFYCFFPAIILTFVYPTHMIAIFTFVPAYFFVSTVTFAIIIKFYEWFLPNTNMILKGIFFTILFTISFIVIVFIYAIVLVFLYALIIGRGSVVCTGPLFIISLFPSIVLSLGAWIAKRVVLNGSRNICSCQDHGVSESTQTEQTV